jgi:3-dehydrotetronate 4-kinase
VLAGSCAERTAEQLDHFGRTRPVLRLDLAAVADDAAAADKATGWAAERIASGPVAITTAARPQEVATIQARFGRRRSARMAEQLLGRIAAGLRAMGVRRFVIAGGETSGAVVEALRIRALAVGPYEAPGQSKAVAIQEQPLSFYLKSGKLGPVDMFARVLGETMSASSA